MGSWFRKTWEDASVIIDGSLTTRLSLYIAVVSGLAYGAIKALGLVGIGGGAALDEAESYLALVSTTSALVSVFSSRRWTRDHQQ